MTPPKFKFALIYILLSYAIGFYEMKAYMNNQIEFRGKSSAALDGSRTNAAFGFVFSPILAPFYVLLEVIDLSENLFSEAL